MRKISYETDEGIFLFDREDPVEALKNLDTDEAREMPDFVESQSGDTVKIHGKKGSFSYTVLNLLDQGKGIAFCKACGREYQANELVFFPVGAGENPLKVKLGDSGSLLNRFLGRQKRMPLFGGKGYQCPEGHELISAVTWRT